jgi:hypothetical protein
LARVLPKVIENLSKLIALPRSDRWGFSTEKSIFRTFITSAALLPLQNQSSVSCVLASISSNGFTRLGIIAAGASSSPGFMPG